MAEMSFFLGQNVYYVRTNEKCECSGVKNIKLFDLMHLCAVFESIRHECSHSQLTAESTVKCINTQAGVNDHRLE